MAMLRSAVGLALRQSAPAARFCGKVGRRNPASNFTTTRNYDTSKMCEFSKEDFVGWKRVEFMIGAFACGIALVFRHYTTPPYEKESSTPVEFTVGAFACGIALVFRHYTTPAYKKESRYNTASFETKSTSDTCEHGQDGREKTE